MCILSLFVELFTNTYWYTRGLNAKWFYLLLYSVALRTLLFSSSRNELNHDILSFIFLVTLILYNSVQV